MITRKPTVQRTLPNSAPRTQEGCAAAQHGDAQAKVTPGEADEDQRQDASRRGESARQVMAKGISLMGELAKRGCFWERYS